MMLSYFVSCSTTLARLICTFLCFAVVITVSSCSDGAVETEPLDTIRLVQDLVIGSAEGGDAFLFTSIPGVAAGPDGRIALIDSQDLRIRVFERDGTFSHYIGRKGSGPGEMERVISLTALGDRLVAADQVRQRFIAFSWDGELLFEKPFPSTSVHPYRTQGLDQNMIVAASSVESLADGTLVEPHESKYLRVFGNTLEQLNLFGTMKEIIDVDSDHEVRAAKFTSVSFSANDASVFVAPRTWGCLAAVYNWRENDPQPLLLNSPECSDKGYKSITEGEYENYRSMNAETRGSIPGQIGATFGPDGRFYSLAWRFVETILERSDGSIAVLVKEWEEGWRLGAEIFASNGQFLGTAKVDGVSEVVKSVFATTDGNGNLYFRRILSVGAPAVVRYRMETDF